MKTKDESEKDKPDAPVGDRRLWGIRSADNILTDIVRTAKTDRTCSMVDAKNEGLSGSANISNSILTSAVLAVGECVASTKIQASILQGVAPD